MPGGSDLRQRRMSELRWRWPGLAKAAAALVYIMATPGAGFGASPVDVETQLQLLRRDVDNLTSGQVAILQQLGEIRLLLRARHQAQGRAADPPRAPVAAPPIVSFETGITADRAVGSEAAPVTIIEYSDMQCSFCTKHQKTVFPQLAAEYIDTGKVRYAYREFPLEMHTDAMVGALALRCAAEQQKYRELHDRLLLLTGPIEREKLFTAAGSAGIDVSSFAVCMDNDKYTSAILTEMTEASRHGITGTPTFLFAIARPESLGTVKVVRMLVGAQPYQNFKATLEELLRETAQNNERITP